MRPGLAATAALLDDLWESIVAVAHLLIEVEGTMSPTQFHHALGSPVPNNRVVQRLAFIHIDPRAP